MRRSVVVLAPLVALSLVLGCPRGHGEASPDAAPSVSVTTASPASESASAAWPKVVVVAEPEAAVEELLDAAEELLLEDAAVDAFADAALDGDARADAKHDANDDAALLGTKTFVDETPMRGIRRITVGAAKVHKAPKDQNIIATLPRGTEVSLVASIYEDWLRVRYSDPNTGVRRQGWIYATTFAGPKTKSCPTNWTWHPQDGGWCDRECTKNTDCKAMKGYKCSGTLCFYAGDEPR